MSGYDDDWVLPPRPNHHWFEGCCGQPRENHPWSEEESRAIGDWMNTEPGLAQQLEYRKGALQRLEELKAPEILLAKQRELITQTEEQMNGRHRAPAPAECTPQTHGIKGNRVWDPDFSCWRCHGCGHRAWTGGQKPKKTRYMWPWKWPRELARREWARTVVLPASER